MNKKELDKLQSQLSKISKTHFCFIFDEELSQSVVFEPEGEHEFYNMTAGMLATMDENEHLKEFLYGVVKFHKHSNQHELLKEKFGNNFGEA